MQNLHKTFGFIMASLFNELKLYFILHRMNQYEMIQVQHTPKFGSYSIISTEYLDLSMNALTHDYVKYRDYFVEQF